MADQSARIGVEDDSMTLKHLRIFIAVHQEMNITKAAARLHMTQPAVSRAIQEMEQYYGVRLFERMNHRLFQTECGRSLYDRALHIVDSFDSMETELRDWGSSGRIRVGSSITIGNYSLSAIISSFQEKHPAVQVHATISNTANIELAVLDNELDLGLIEDYPVNPSLIASPLAHDHLSLILPVGHPLCRTERICIRDITAYPLLLREKGSAGRSFLDHVFAVHGLSCTPLWESSSTQALVRGVSAGLGLSLLPDRLVRADIESGAVATRPVEDESFTRTSYLIWHEQKYLSDLLKEFIALSQTVIHGET